MEKTIAVLPGDGIGPEVMNQSLKVLQSVESRFGHKFTTKFGLAGGAAYEKYGEHLPEETLDLCQSSDAILFSAVGGPVSEQHLPKWKNCESNSILALRKHFKFNVNLRPVKLNPNLEEICPLKRNVIEKGVDIIFIRELLGDAYFGKKESKQRDGRRYACDTAEYTEDQVASVAHFAFKLAAKRRRKVTSVDKANVLETSRLWRAVLHEVHTQYQDIELEDILVDNCAMQIISNPSQFDVVVAPNMFGDILTDEAAVLAGSLGLLASASLNNNGMGLYEPPGGSAPDIADKGVANPIGQILCVALMLRCSFGLEQEARAIETAVEAALNAGYRTGDIYCQGNMLVNTEEMTEHILSSLRVPLSV